MSDPESAPPTTPGSDASPTPPPAAADGWVPDILPGFERLTLELEADEQGDVVATLVRRAHSSDRHALPDAGVDVLYVHGWNDYFFQTHLADFWQRQGARFFALDLRKYGRSIREHQTPGFIRDLSTYDEDIEAALVAMGHPAPAPADPGTPGAAVAALGDAAASAAGPLAGSLPSGGIAAAAMRALFKDPISELLSRGSTTSATSRSDEGRGPAEDPAMPRPAPTLPPTPTPPPTPAPPPTPTPPPTLTSRRDSAPGTPAQDLEGLSDGPLPGPAPLPEAHRIAHPGETLEDASHMEPDPRRRKLLLVGHSTGGLILSLWVSRHPGWADGLVLNSPWLEFQTRNIGRRLLEPGVRVHAALAPQNQMLNVDLGLYTRSISSRFDGEWDYDPTLRSDAGWHATPAWLSAILQGQEAVARGLGITVPVLALFSASSTLPLVWSEAAMHSDTVLDVVGVARRAADLGSHVTIVRIEGALHDVTLSAAPVREVVWTESERWFATYMGPRPAADRLHR